MKFLLAFLALVLTASIANAKGDAPPAPHSLVVIACRVVDHGWLPNGEQTGARDLEWFVNKDQEYECKRLEADLVDETPFQKAAAGMVPELDPNFGNPATCAMRGMALAPKWAEQNPGWAVMAIGCPVPNMDDNGTPSDKSDDRVVGWHLPECPTFQPGTNNRMRCHFDESVI